MRFTAILTVILAAGSVGGCIGPAAMKQKMVEEKNCESEGKQCFQRIMEEGGIPNMTTCHVTLMANCVGPGGPV
jgi:hypothetical protein